MAEASRIFHTALLPTFPHFQNANSNSRSSSTTFPRKNSARVSCSLSTANNETNTKAASAQTAIPWGCDVDLVENASALQKWLSDSGLPPQKMAIERVEIGERGLVALKNIRKGEKLLFVPPSLFITADSVTSSLLF